MLKIRSFMLLIFHFFSLANIFVQLMITMYWMNFHSQIVRECFNVDVQLSILHSISFPHFLLDELLVVQSEGTEICSSYVHFKRPEIFNNSKRIEVNIQCMHTPKFSKSIIYSGANCMSFMHKKIVGITWIHGFERNCCS